MNIQEVVTDRIIAALDNGIIPWRKEWTASNALPSNYITKKPYRGINTWMLLCSEFPSNEWMTYKQAQSIGAQVRKGEKGSPVVFWKFDNVKIDKATGDEKAWAFAKQYTVFNVAQIDGLPASLPFDAPVFHPLEAADALVSIYLASASAPQFAHDGGNKAFYSPTYDKVSMPARESFHNSEGYYSTLFHEFAHSTGHASRLDRFTDTNMQFKSESYSKEELIAEFAAAFLCAESAITNAESETNSVAYIQGWLKALKNDKTMAMQAAQRAQKAADYITGHKFVTATVTE